MQKNSKSFSRLTVLYAAAIGDGYSVFIKRGRQHFLSCILLIAVLKRREKLSTAGDTRLS